MGDITGRCYLGNGALSWIRDQVDGQAFPGMPALALSSSHCDGTHMVGPTPLGVMDGSWLGPALQSEAGPVSRCSGRTTDTSPAQGSDDAGKVGEAGARQTP